MPDQLTLPADLNNLACIRDYVKDAASVAGLDASASYKLQLAVDEIATNIIMYGYAQSSTLGQVVIRAEQLDDCLRVTLEDTGVAFDPTTKVAQEDSNTNLPLEEREIGGLGIFL